MRSSLSPAACRRAELPLLVQKILVKSESNFPLLPFTVYVSSSAQQGLNLLGGAGLTLSCSHQITHNCCTAASWGPWEAFWAVWSTCSTKSLELNIYSLLAKEDGSQWLVHLLPALCFGTVQLKLDTVFISCCLSTWEGYVPKAHKLPRQIRWVHLGKIIREQLLENLSIGETLF